MTIPILIGQTLLYIINGMAMIVFVLWVFLVIHHELLEETQKCTLIEHTALLLCEATNSTDRRYHIYHAMVNGQ